MPRQFDVVTSRFGTMFFADPVAAFSDIARAAHPETRLVMLVWQSHDRNDWAVEIDAALSPGQPTPGSAHGANHFSLAQPPEVESILGVAGFSDIGFEDVHEPVFYGPDARSPTRLFAA